MSRTLRAAAVLLLAAGLSLVGVPPAHAVVGGNAFALGGTLYFVAVPGVSNAAWVDMFNGDFQFEDAHQITPGAGCVATALVNIVNCSPVGITTILINTGNQNDTLGVRTTLDGNPTVFLYGGDGNDVLFGRDGDETLSGGAGIDTLKGGPGDDLLFGGSQGDTMLGEEGLGDTVSYADHGNVGISADADGLPADDGQAGEGDTIGADVENIVGTSGPDFVMGGPGPNALIGGGGDDTLVGAGGSDNLDGGIGYDTLYGDGGTASRSDVDTCVLGPDGGNPIGCEVVR